MLARRLHRPAACLLDWQLAAGRERWALAPYRTVAVVVLRGWVAVGTARLGFVVPPGVTLWLPGTLDRWVCAPQGAAVLHVEATLSMFRPRLTELASTSLDRLQELRGWTRCDDIQSWMRGDGSASCAPAVGSTGARRIGRSSR